MKEELEKDVNTLKAGLNAVKNEVDFYQLIGDLKIFGTSRDHGGNPTQDMPKSGNSVNLSQVVESFNPKFLCAIYIKFKNRHNQPALVIRHGYEEIPEGANEEERQRIAENLLKIAKIAQGPGNWRRPNRPSMPNQSRQWRRHSDFEDLTFDSQNLIYVLVDNEDIEFDARKNLSGKTENLVRFTEYVSEMDSPIINKIRAEKNNSFFNVGLVDAQAKAFSGKKLLTLQNWYTDRDGIAVTKDSKLLYSMNIHLLMEAADGSKIPIIIDPDTGNGWGSRP